MSSILESNEEHNRLGESLPSALVSVSGTVGSTVPGVGSHSHKHTCFPAERRLKQGGIDRWIINSGLLPLAVSLVFGDGTRSLEQTPAVKCARITLSFLLGGMR